MKDIDALIEKALKQLENFSINDRQLADETYAKFNDVFEMARSTNNKIPDGIIEGMNKALLLRIASTERLSKIINQLLRLRSSVEKPYNEGNADDHKELLNKLNKSQGVAV
jgi:hypothetical protein